MTILTRGCVWRVVSVEVAAAAEESEESVVKALAQEKKVTDTEAPIDTLMSHAVAWWLDRCFRVKGGGQSLDGPLL